MFEKSTTPDSDDEDEDVDEVADEVELSTKVLATFKMELERERVFGCCPVGSTLD